MTRKVSIGYVLAFLLGWNIWSTVSAAQHGHPRATDADAQAFFTAYNNEFFDGKLPATTVHFADNLKTLQGQDAQEMTYPGNPWRIAIMSESSNNTTEWEELELHGMCHVATDSNTVIGPEFDDHGPRWQKCMIRLADIGAMKGIW